MKTQRIYVDANSSHYIGDDCPMWIYALNTKKAVDKRFNFHWHSDLELYYIMDGEYECLIKDETVMLSPGDICIVSPGVDHSVQAITSRAKYFSTGLSMKMMSMDEGHFFQKEFVEPLATNMLDFSPIVRPSDKDYNSFFEPIKQLSVNMERTDKRICFAAAMQICCALMGRSTPKDRFAAGCSREHAQVRRCTDYIRENYMKKIPLEFLAQMVNLHPNYLCTVFNKYEGCSPMTYLNKIRMKRARALLRETDMSVKQVAECTGFNSASFFSKRFKAVMGISPREYADAYRKE